MAVLKVGAGRDGAGRGQLAEAVLGELRAGWTARGLQAERCQVGTAF